MSLYQHKPHPHKPQNVNQLHQAELASVNQRLAVNLTRWIGSMPCAYLFSLVSFVGLLGLLGVLPEIVYQLEQWFSSQFLQLVLLSVIMVGQAILSRKQELQSDEQFSTTNKIYHDIEQIIQHQSAQDEELLKQSKILEDILQTLQQRRKS